MIINTISFEIDFSSINLNEEQYAEIMDIIEIEMKKEHSDGISFEEIKEIIPLDKLRYYPASIQYPDYEFFDGDSVVTKETKITIKA